MGKGDKKSKRGKINIGSYGNTRKRKTPKKAMVVIEKPAKTEKALTAKKKTAAKTSK
jgi:30S ribosomal protein S31